MSLVVAETGRVAAELFMKTRRLMAFCTFTARGLKVEKAEMD